VIGNDLPGYAALSVHAIDLKQEAFLQVRCADARRVERLHHSQGFPNVLQLVFASGGDLFERS
jgi:hypothetical protein